MYILFNIKVMITIYIFAIPAVITSLYSKGEPLDLGLYMISIFIIAPLVTFSFIIIGTTSMLFLNWLMPGVF